MNDRVKSSQSVGYEVSFLILPFVLVASAVGHWVQSGDLAAYRESPLIVVEMIALLLSVFTPLIYLCFAIYCLLKKQFKRAAISALFVVATIVAIGFSVWIDASTLLYAT